MIWLSEMLMQNQDLESFEQLLELVRERAREGERFLSSDVRPPFPDTPMDWEERIEAAFTSASG
ncbi:hypothetical protein TVNIR_0863 [Thioalkalivibrio nitratireducens DSM 14787]|uniref:Sulfur relay protein DsrC n=1 Tax=Thioalkalivibrio nitratireducens (strain DSM 14787 / UNIQEM 213 / ALEN2) TaxID=1255043 RepID=L0DU50_THIND|nr:hypothetical protein [Thioalkalivibrio nitratireducens]AGA32553.1 hypothetical protein TVNIR_0863 [Thioalkalivibrio nitratireducens DSM 14787]